MNLWRDLKFALRSLARSNTDWTRWIEFSTPRYNASTVDWFTLNRQYLASMAISESTRR